MTDPVLLQAARTRGANILATDDRKLVQACHQVDITVENPIGASLRQQMASWEAANLPQKGLPRILRQIHQWLEQNYQQAAEDSGSKQVVGAVYLSNANIRADIAVKQKLSESRICANLDLREFIGLRGLTFCCVIILTL